MEIHELEQEIRQIINDATGEEYVGKLKVEKDGDIYILRLFLYQYYQTQIALMKQGTEDEFKKYVADEMKKRKIQKNHWYVTRLEYPALECKDGVLTYEQR